MDIGANGALTPALELEGMTKRFGRTVALDSASIVVAPRTVHAILGENGAGKTTLMRIAYGLLAPDAGKLTIHGEVCTLESPAAAITRGVGMVQQHFALVPAMTVTENVALGLPGFRHDASGTRARIADIGRRTGLVLEPDAVAGALPVGAQQRLEIIKALARDPRILILDEPTAVLAPLESAELMTALRGFADQGGAVVLITHKLREVLAIADRVTVLRGGRDVLHARASEVREPDLAQAMVGDESTREVITTRARGALGDVVMRVTDLRVSDERGAERVRGVSLDVRRGEIVGIVGVEGSGHRELLRAVAGRVPALSGHIDRPRSVGFVPEDRQHEGLVLEHSLAENVALRGAGDRPGRMPWNAIRARTAALVKEFDVRAPALEVPAAVLSGGNQQKLVLARELAGGPDLLIVENATRGLDITAASAIRQRLTDARDAGAAVLLYSSDLDEILDLADRIVVLFAGRAVEVPADRTRIGEAMSGV